MYVKVLGKEGRYGACIARFVHMSISPGAKRGKEGRYGGEARRGGKEGRYGARIARFVHMSISPGAKRGMERVSRELQYGILIG